MSKLKRANEIRKSDGHLELLSATLWWFSNKYLRHVHCNIVRPFLPVRGGPVKLNGVPIRDEDLMYHYFDRKFPWDTPHRPDDPDYEAEITAALEDVVKEEDEIVIVGGGLGVSTTTAANATGENGAVTVYEASPRRVNLIKRTLSANNTPTSPDVHTAIVGEPVSIAGDPAGVSKVSPSELSDCDVLELDCEGAELKILKELEIRPRVIIVETHANYGATEEAVRKELDRLGYHVTNREAEVASRGIYVLTALRDN